MAQTRKKSRKLFKKTNMRGHVKKPKKPAVQNKKLRPYWDSKKSYLKNYESLGIRVDFDHPTTTPFSPDMLAPFTSKEYKPTVRKLKAWEAEILRKMLQKHKNDYKVMAKDRLNIWIWTSKQIQNMISLLK